ncbi:biotin/lipoyl-binding protein [Desulfovibrio desulfuricans]|uniref:CzcB-like barrel-sandwich hybrid domain-containing protein n=1 Tax=uncultured Desulfovibrio sp. TaxID=167968 RepID=A0A212IZV2_9BACT|nr:biotin/lipoyl-binding protein [Desulfovibrio desulfuricans]MBD8894643.1 biotin/lipoyl-binding protein [Desulfovibrio desulfuricans]MCB6540839.1 biotin/lipoyl-binding protein [Desulfovibrio desulfuricans]MCB6551921.1 biotin/lipoyl-binding protein [Desulfovibrio desulfuricans]MCB6563763.1 biotin/lipoyl-binding protein [Desulfovibrio desulfuricans]MCB7344647.1 biotin/lipoyl-binding protein [Desulfovibrio desulfuricans]
MPEPIYLQMPEPRLKKHGRMFLRLLPLWVIGCLVAAGWWWIESGRVTSTWAMLDGMVYAVSSEFPAKVESVAVREGDRVKKGQVLARLDARAYAGRVGEAGREAAGLRAMAGPPSIEETAARLKQAQDSEQEMVRRIALARHDEDLKQKAREERVAEHVRAQLALRTLDSQGGERAVGSARYAAAKQAEAQTRLAKERAIVEFEQVSLVRAAIDQELARVRAEALRYKQLASSNRYAPKYVAGALGAAMNAVPQNAVDGNLYAPQDGRILRGIAMPGQSVQRGEPVVLLLPEGKEAQKSFWLLAFFTQDAANALKPGQKCAITLKNDTRLEGRVYDRLDPQPLPPNALADSKDASETAARPEVYVPVRITISDGEGKQFEPGMLGKCEVMTRVFWN